MPTCSTCRTVNETTDRFCRNCGARLPQAPSAPPPSKLQPGGTQLMAQSGSAAPPPALTKTDPFAQTVLGSSLDSVPPPAAPQASVSPMASSVMATPAMVQAASASLRTPSPTPVPPPPPVHRTPPPPAHALGPGSSVTVRWSDGNTYKGTVKQANGPQVLVVFPGGLEHWIDRQYVSPG
jgi:hypothetical protein